MNYWTNKTEASGWSDSPADEGLDLSFVAVCAFIGLGVVSVATVVLFGIFRLVTWAWPVLMVWLAGCAAIPQPVVPVTPATPPTHIAAIFTDVTRRIQYQHYAKTDFREIKGKGKGNCSVIAYNMYLEAKRAGYSPIIHTCLTPGLEGHQYTEVEGWALDNRESIVIPMRDVICTDYRKPYTGQ